MLALVNLPSIALYIALFASFTFGASLNQPRFACAMSMCTGATRFPPLSPSNNNLDAAQLVQYEFLINTTKKIYGDTIITEGADGSLQGPFNQLLYTPTIVQSWTAQQLGAAGLMTSKENEAAVLGILSINRATYGLYAHTLLAQKAGFTLEQVLSMLAGFCATGLSTRESAIYNLAVKLAQMRGPLDQASYDAAFAVLGHEGVEATIQQAAAFSYSAMMLNAGDVCVPQGAGC
ncbi:hypothetical protein LSUB1_G003941 [Lachnellula subtilissima]|uniref:Carboxymuconolactone decarboxylase-like domain-containing protein n=1 Tax=Lachnellula subtilissima TaxID=602034 RepID=A0A8H8RQN8_9HELO|nr:hypothetical protein LSUB1_G003941 [Lachnellula subtilissima]